MTDKKPLKHKSDSDWRKILSPELYNIARLSGTERPYTGKYNDEYRDGIYHCACCDTPLFSSDMKFPTHCGWPGFAKPITDTTISEHADNTLLHCTRTEVKCTACEAHLGHVFKDGPAEMGGLRYCINSISLVLKHP